ncbi:MAG TPA: phytanoyl-CoA dioxygenase family protein, partial [Acetobacteraceae bacterium]
MPQARAMPKILSPAQIDAFHHDGFVSPVRAIPTERALYYRRRLEAFESAYPEHRIKLDQKAHMICPWVDEMIREPGILDATEDLIGPDILCWGTSLRAKQADGKTFAGWHQDTAYADVKPIVVIVALALSPARAGNGCIRGIPGSHRGPLLPHKEAFATSSLLSREQYIDAPFDEAA